MLLCCYYAAITVFWVCKEDMIVKSRCYKKHYNNMNLNNIITNFKTTLLKKRVFQRLLKYRKLFFFIM